MTTLIAIALFLLAGLVGAGLSVLALTLARPVTMRLRWRRLRRQLGFGRRWHPQLLQSLQANPTRTDIAPGPRDVVVEPES